MNMKQIVAFMGLCIILWEYYSIRVLIFEINANWIGIKKAKKEVKISFSTMASSTARWFKRETDTGWMDN